jgi:hypothetical protein
MREELIPEQHAIFETAMQQPRALGRLVSIDPRDVEFPMMRSVDQQQLSGKTYRYYMTDAAMNQGRKPWCVEYAWQQFLRSAPVKNPKWKSPGDLYREAQKVDEWVGESYDGTSVRAGAKVLQREGLLSSYTWAFSSLTAAQYVLSAGPVVFGTNWYEGMNTPDAQGFIQATGPLRGGHAYMIKGVNFKKVCPDGSLGAFRIINSWGRDWADRGMAWLSFIDADRLIREWGEACTATEIKFRVEAEG